jgi:hypothetical protein
LRGGGGGKYNTSKISHRPLTQFQLNSIQQQIPSFSLIVVVSGWSSDDHCIVVETAAAEASKALYQG